MNYFGPPRFPPNSDVNWAQLAQYWINHNHANIPFPPQNANAAYQQQPQFLPTTIYPSNLNSNPVVRPSFFPPPPTANIRPPFVHGHFSSNPYYPRFSGKPESVRYPPTKISEKEEEYSAHYDPSLTQDETLVEETSIFCNVNSGNIANWMVDPTQWAAAAQFPANHIIDSQMRKRLPAWILEGLEKAEKEKQKKLEKEEIERKIKEDDEKKRLEREAKGLGKFDSDESDESGSDEAKQSNSELSSNTTDLKLGHRKFKEFIVKRDDRAEDERMEEALAVVRRLITLVLMGSTDSLIVELVKNMSTSNKKEVQAKILQPSSALIALSALDGDDAEDEGTNDEDLDQYAQTSSCLNNNQDELAFKVPSLPMNKSKLENDRCTNLISTTIELKNNDEQLETMMDSESKVSTNQETHNGVKEEVISSLIHDNDGTSSTKTLKQSFIESKNQNTNVKPSKDAEPKGAKNGVRSGKDLNKSARDKHSKVTSKRSRSRSRSRRRSRSSHKVRSRSPRKRSRSRRGRSRSRRRSPSPARNRSRRRSRLRSRSPHRESCSSRKKERSRSRRSRSRRRRSRSLEKRRRTRSRSSSLRRQSRSRSRGHIRRRSRSRSRRISRSRSPRYRSRSVSPIRRSRRS